MALSEWHPGLPSHDVGDGAVRTSIPATFLHPKRVAVGGCSWGGSSSETKLGRLDSGQERRLRDLASPGPGAGGLCRMYVHTASPWATETASGSAREAGVWCGPGASEAARRGKPRPFGCRGHQNQHHCILGPSPSGAQPEITGPHGLVDAWRTKSPCRVLPFRVGLASAEHRPLARHRVAGIVIEDIADNNNGLRHRVATARLRTRC